MARKLAVLFLGLAGCVGAGQWYPLYTGPRPPSDGVAHLSGYVQKVDGQDVRKLGHNFELLPGCHLVTTPLEWGHMGDLSGLRATTGRIVFPMAMRGGYSYVIDVRPDASVGGTSSLRIRAEEKDAQGTVTRTFARLPEGTLTGPCTDEKGEDIRVPASPM